MVSGGITFEHLPIRGSPSKPPLKQLEFATPTEHNYPCFMYRLLYPRKRGCPHQWTSGTRAQFAVRKSTVRSRPLHVYQRLAAAFVETPPVPLAAGQQGEFSACKAADRKVPGKRFDRWEFALELFWSTLFGCSLFRCHAGGALAHRCGPDARQADRGQIGPHPESIANDSWPLGCTRFHN